MTCTGCGGRKAVRYTSYSQPKVEEKYPTLALVEYKGDKVLCVRGAVSGNEYVFSPTRRLLFVDVRDLEGLGDDFEC